MKYKGVDPIQKCKPFRLYFSFEQGILGIFKSPAKAQISPPTFLLIVRQIPAIFAFEIIWQPVIIISNKHRDIW